AASLSPGRPGRRPQAPPALIAAHAPWWHRPLTRPPRGRSYTGRPWGQPPPARPSGTGGGGARSRSGRGPAAPPARHRRGRTGRRSTPPSSAGFQTPVAWAVPRTRVSAPPGITVV